MERGPGTHALKRSAIAGAMLVALGATSACTPTLVRSDERETMCRIVVEERFAALDIQANPVATPAGGSVVGAGSAALIALGIVTLNPWAVIQGAAGAAAGLGCAAAGAAHPHAETDFREIAVTADRGALKRALETAFAAPRPACANVPERAVAAPDAVIRLESIVLTLGCPAGPEAYYVTVRWRATTGTGDKVLAESATRCLQVSDSDVDSWSADAVHAREEVDGALARTGQRIAAELLGPHPRTPCKFEPEARTEGGPR